MILLTERPVNIAMILTLANLDYSLTKHVLLCSCLPKLYLYAELESGGCLVILLTVRLVNITIIHKYCCPVMLKSICKQMI